MSANDVDIIITAMDRPKCLENLLYSIPTGYRHNVTVIDQSEETIDYAWEDGVFKTIQIPYDSGLSYARNFLVENTKRPYILLLEDDFEWTKETHINKLLQLLESKKDVGVVGGSVTQNGRPIDFQFIPVIKDGTLYHRPDGDNWKEYRHIRYKETGCVMNFALFRREVFDDVQWDEKLKLREHQDFYVELAKTNWRVLFTPEVKIADAKPPHTPEYRKLKQRDEFLVTMMKKHGLKKIKYQNGSCRILQDNKIIKTREAPL